MGDERMFRIIFYGLFSMLIYPPLAAIFGGVSGWAVGLALEDEIREVLGFYGMNPTVSFFQMGATLGFIGGYFRSVFAEKS